MKYIKHYKVYYKEQLLYVGQTSNFLAVRRALHKQDNTFKDYPWDKLKWVIYRKEPNWEAITINEEKPLLNKHKYTSKERMYDSIKKYLKSPKGKIAVKRYQQSPKGKLAYARASKKYYLKKKRELNC